MKNKLISLLISVVVALGMWLYVITVVSPGSKAPFYNVPVYLEGASILEERGLEFQFGANVVTWISLLFY